MTLGEKIKQLRTQADLTQPELAQAAGIEQSYLSKLENDKAAPSFDVISKLANAFNLEALTLIESLSEQYLQDNLAHLPEVAIKLEQRRKQARDKFKRGYTLAAIMIVLGIAGVLLGKSDGIFSNMVYQYQSQGVIKQGEPLYQFATFRLDELQETRDEQIARIKANIPRLDEVIVLTNDYRGNSYIEKIGDGRRLYRLDREREVRSAWQDIVLVLGMVLITTGGFGLGYVFKFNK